MTQLIPHLGADPVILALQGYGAFDALIGPLRALMGVLSVLGFLLGCAIKALAGPDEDKHALAHKMIGACLAGLVFVTLAPDLYDLMFGWTGK